MRLDKWKFDFFLTSNLYPQDPTSNFYYPASMSMSIQSPTIIITGGGTGGHFFPALAVAEELKISRPKFRVLFLGSGADWEKKEARKSGIAYKGIVAGKFRRYWSWKNFGDGLKFMIGIFQSLWVMIWKRPKLVFSKGGHISLPVTLSACILGIPVFIHESDTRLGLANRIASRFAQKIFLGFPVGIYKDAPIEKSIYSGIPIRREFTHNIEPNDLKKPSLTKNSDIILVIGGSQGAHFINKIIAQISDEILKKHQLTHICGKRDLKKMKDLRKNLAEEKQKRYCLADFLDNNEVAKAIARADLIISRAGANALAEFSVLGKPTILIPLESDGHQEENAKIYAREGAAVLLKENTITPTSLLEIINRLLEDKKELEAMGRKARSLANPEAAETIAEEICAV